MATNATATTQTTADTPASGDSGYADSAMTMFEQIQAMKQEVPKFTVPVDVNSSRKLASTGSVPLEAVNKVLTLIQQRPLLTVNGLGPDQFRDRVAYAFAYGPVSVEIDAFATELRHSVLTARSELGRATLTVYEVIKRESKRPEAADLRPHVADLRRLLSTRFGKKKHQSQLPSQQATPQAPSPSSSASAPTAAQLTDPMETSTSKSQ